MLETGSYSGKVLQTRSRVFTVGRNSFFPFLVF